jgi:hypothetical protein
MMQQRVEHPGSTRGVFAVGAGAVCGGEVGATGEVTNIAEARKTPPRMNRLIMVHVPSVVSFAARHAPRPDQRFSKGEATVAR